MPKYCHFEYVLVNFDMFSAWLGACACKLEQLEKLLKGKMLIKKLLTEEISGFSAL